MQAKKTLILVAVAALLGVSLLYAQGNAAPRLDPATAITLEGAVISFNNDPSKPATLVVDDAAMGKTVVRLGPGLVSGGPRLLRCRGRVGQDCCQSLLRLLGRLGRNSGRESGHRCHHRAARR